MIQVTFTDAEINVLEYERYHHPVPFQISAEIIGGPSPQRLALVQGTLQPGQVTSKTVASTWPHRAAGGRVGIWLIDAPTTTVDDFGGGTLP